MLSVLALIYAELGATYPVAGGTGRFPYFSHGPLAGFTAGWASWLQAVAIAPIEILAAITYVNSVSAVNEHFAMLHDRAPTQACSTRRGLLVATVLMVLFTGDQPRRREVHVREQRDRRHLEDRRARCWPSSWSRPCRSTPATSRAGGGFAPYGMHGIFAALPAGVVFALQGFEQAVQLAGEARNPKKDLSRAIMVAMTIGALLYTLLQVVFIAGRRARRHRQELGRPAGRRPVGLRRLVHPGAGCRRRPGWPPSSSSTRSSPRPAPASSTSARPRGCPTPSARSARCPARWPGSTSTRRPGRLDPGRGGRRRCLLRTVPELEQAGRRRHRCDRDHVRVRAGLAGGAAEGATATGRGRTGCRCRTSCCRRPSCRPT